MLNEVVVRAVAAVSRGDDTVGSLTVRRRGLRSQERLLDLIEAGEGAEAEAHWRSHLQVVGPRWNEAIRTVGVHTYGVTVSVPLIP